jgi:hypothetical protein
VWIFIVQVHADVQVPPAGVPAAPQALAKVSRVSVIAAVKVLFAVRVKTVVSRWRQKHAGALPLAVWPSRNKVPTLFETAPCPKDPSGPKLTMPTAAVYVKGCMWTAPGAVPQPSLIPVVPTMSKQYEPAVNP